MRKAISAWRLFARVALGILLLTMTAIGILSSCDSSEVPAAIDVGTGGTYGAEISLSVVGRGRVTTSPAVIDCPSNCFGRIVFPSASTDGGDGGITLIAQDTPGAHFTGWTFADAELGARGHGPPQCSPMTRRTSVPPSENGSTVISVPFGETQGTPPHGHEAECAAFTNVSLAYAVTATFEDDLPTPGFDSAIDPADQDVLFLPVAERSAAKEIGVTSGYAYWRFEVDGLSGIAGSDLASYTASVIVAPGQVVRSFDVDRHAVFQYDDGSLWVILAGAMTTTPLGMAPPCAALASDALNVYCRAALDGGTAIYAWPVTAPDAATPPSIIHLLPPGNDLGVDTQRFYFSEDNGVFGGPAKVLSVTRLADVDGQAPVFTTLALGQTSPLTMAVGPSYLAWIDDLRNGTFASRSASKFFQQSVPADGPAASTLRYVVADPGIDQYWVGVGDDGNGAWLIYRVTSGTSSTTFFRTGTTDLGGIAVDATHVYWTRPNGRVYRAFKNGESSGPGLPQK
jgi:hypothetical protein